MSTPRRSHSSAPGKLLLYAGSAGLLLVLALAAGVLVEVVFAVPILLLGVLVLGFFALNDLMARRALHRHGDDSLAVQEDENESLPTAHVIPDETALGDTAEAHAEISPHDLPKDAPGRRAAEEQAGRSAGTTRGNRNGAAGGPQLTREDAPLQRP